MAQLLSDCLARYKDSFQQKVEWEDKDFGPLGKVRLPLFQLRALEHSLMIVINGPTGLESEARDCVYTSAGVFLGPLCAAYLGAGMGAVGVAGKTFTDSVTACLAAKAAAAANQIEVKFDDRLGRVALGMKYAANASPAARGWA